MNVLKRQLVNVWDANVYGVQLMVCLVINFAKFRNVLHWWQQRSQLLCWRLGGRYGKRRRTRQRELSAICRKGR